MRRERIGKNFRKTGRCTFHDRCWKDPVFRGPGLGGVTSGWGSAGGEDAAAPRTMWQEAVERDGITYPHRFTYLGD